MTHSYAEQVNISCRNCGNAFRTKVWMLVDMAEQPDLMERIRTGSLHNMACPKCGATMTVAAPLLIYRSHDVQPFLFSPPTGKSAEDEEGTNQAINLLRILRQLLGSDWREDWLDNEGIISIRRAVLPGYLDQGTEALYQTFSSSLEQALREFLEADTWEMKRQVVESQPELVNQGADLILSKYITKEGNPEVKEALIEHRDLLRQCRIIGVEAAFLERTNDPNFILQKIYHAEQSNDWYSCIVLCRQALSIIDRNSDPFIWGMLHGALGNSLLKYPLGERAENLELAIYHHQMALEAYTQKDFPERWALNQFSLANAYQARVRGERVENLELALHHYEQALKVYTREAFAKEWAMVLNNLMGIYSLRIRGRKDENQELAIHFAHKCLEVLTLELSPEMWGGIHTNLAKTFNERVRGDRAENQELAINHCRQALEAFTREKFPEGWADTQITLADIYKSHIRGERAEDLENAIYHYRKALEIYTRTAFPERWADLQDDLANTYLNRIIGDRSDNLEQAIHCSLEALKVYTREAFPRGWASTNRSLALLYWSRMTGDRSENLEQAIHCSSQALEVYTRAANADLWAGIQNNLANIYRDRILGDRSHNLEQAIHCCQHALEVYTRETHPAIWAGIQHHLGTNYSNRIRGEKTENLDQAIYHYHQALEVRSLDRFPSDHRQTQRDIGNLHFYDGNWERARLAYKAAIEAGRELFEISYTEAGRRAEVGETSPLYANDAYCLLQLRQPAKALLRLEQCKTRLLAEALQLAEVDLAQLPELHQRAIQTARGKVSSLEAEMRLPSDTPALHDERGLAKALHQARANLNHLIETIRVEYSGFLPTGLDLPNLLALIPKGGALVAPLFTSKGSAVFVVPHASETVNEEHVILLDKFTISDLNELLVGPAEGEFCGWLRAYSNHLTNSEGWFKVIESTTRRLWDVLMGPVHERLAKLGLGEGDQVLLMPHGGLGLLPTHTAWREVNGEKRAFIDDYTVIYTPSGTTLHISRRRLEERLHMQRSLLAVVNPTSDLRFTPIEAELIAALFEQTQCRALKEVEAYPEAVIRNAAGRSYLHFACHGYYSWLDPMQSGLLLADQAPLTVANIIAKMDLKATRMVTLSACETGMTEFQKTPDEYLGLPAGFLQAGAPAVVSSLWAVDDLSTMLLMQRFYKHHLNDALHPAIALRKAQLWLRDVTAEETIEMFDSYRDMALSRSHMPYLLATEAFRKHIFSDRRDLVSDTEARPFNHPFYWAAFTFSGA